MDPTAIGPPAARDRLGDTVRTEIARRPIRWAGLPDIGPSVPIVVVTFARSLGPGATIAETASRCHLPDPDLCPRPPGRPARRPVPEIDDLARSQSRY